MTSLGANFKRARESRGISLAQIARETRISTRFLTAIENEDFESLPGGIFNRGFVRTFAKAVGIDADQAVADYERLVAAEPEPIQVTAAAGVPVPAKRQNRLYSIAVTLLAIAIALFYIVAHGAGL